MSCIKVTASRGSGSCIRINAFLGGACITVTANKEDAEDAKDVPELPELPPVETIIAFECYDIIGHGLNEILAIGEYTETEDGTITLARNILAKCSAVIGFGSDTMLIYDFDMWTEVPDLTELCYLNAFDVSSGQDNVAIVYSNGTKVRYFDGQLFGEISYIEDRHGYIYDAFYETDTEMMTGIMTNKDFSVQGTLISEYGEYSGLVSSRCEETWCEALVATAQPYSGACPDYVQESRSNYAQCPPFGDVVWWSYTFRWTKTTTTQNTSLYSKAAEFRNIYSIGNDTQSRLSDICTSTPHTYIQGSTASTEYLCYSTLTAVSPPAVDYGKISGREDFIFIDNILSDPYDSFAMFREFRGLNKGGKVETGCDGYQYFDNARVSDSTIGVGAPWSPSEYIQLNAGDPHKVQTGSDWVGIGSACVSVDRAFVCENLPTSPCGKTGAIVGDRVVIPISAEDESDALFALDQSFVISENQTPAQAVE